MSERQTQSNGAGNARKPKERPREREVNLTTRMTDHEALMWNIEKDPWLNPSGASLTILDRPVDMERFRSQMRYGVSKMPRLYQRVVPGLGRLTPPTWVPDPEFNFDYHVRELDLPSPGTERQLFDLAAQLYEEPLDRTRPLWRFVVISGLEGGRGAIWALTHHVIADGIGQLRMAELYQQISRDQPAPDPVDLEAIVAAAVEKHGTSQGGDLATNLLGTANETASHLIRRQAGIGRRFAAELMMWPADPGRINQRIGTVATAVESTASMLTKPSGKKPGGSPLWRNRSRHRRLEYVQVPLQELKDAAHGLGGSVNDAFMIGLTEAAVRYHADRDTVVDTFNTSFVVSTRTDSAMGGNSFTPVLVQVDGRPANFKTRMRELRQATTAARERSSKGGGITGLSAAINMLPTSVITRTARRQAAAIDFATSNLRGAPFALYCAGAKVEATVCMGPLAGTAANVTALSNNGNFDIGLFLDPKAIEDPEAYRTHVHESFVDLLATVNRAKTPTKKSSAKKTPAKKTPAKKTTARKTPAKKQPAARRNGAAKQAAGARLS